ncbi:putative protein in type-1 retrotransposable element R1DM [Chionoecetes opilio]|uniref:Reverse transcriptase domain-containing protein n=1 Tax=Chionoecetes opilio TaxID=41210 RepID=A0A8J4YFF2_CHIOP|nr:putative protein in type-1 retrotransposable element R1DM [Chionoecetes opilio]
MDGQMARWAEYFGQLFTVDPPTEQLHTTGLQAVDADPPIDETAPSLDKVREAVAKLKGGKAAGVCNISAELLKAGGEAMIRGLHAVLTAVWQSGTIPPDWKRGLVVPIWKGKGDRQDCNNYRGITLLSVPGKVLAHLLLTRIRSHLVKHQRPQQSGFTPGKSTTDRILALRVLVERRREFRQGMLAAYVDLKKAFDSVHRESLWDLLRLRGIPARTIGLITGLYSGTESAVKCGAGVSSFFPVNTGVRQGCVLTPSLFNACMDWVLDKVVDQSYCGASVGNTKILIFADDAVIFAESLEVLVMVLEALHEEAKPLGLEVYWLKTKVQVFGDLLDEAVQFVHACGEDIEILESFKYLGSAVHNDGGSRQEVLRRIGIAHGVMDSLSGSIWRCRYLCRRTKIRIFKSLVIPVLLYGCETWTLNSDLKRRINAFGNKCLRRIMGVWGYIGCMVFTPFSGWLIDTMSHDIQVPDYSLLIHTFTSTFRPAFYLFVGLQGLAGLLALSVDLKFKTPCEHIIKNIWMLLHNPEVIMLLFAMTLSGAFFGFLEAFLFWFLGDLGASRSLMGLTVTMGAASALPFLIFMSPIVNKFGHIGVIAAGFLMYALRFAGKSSSSSSSSFNITNI